MLVLLTALLLLLSASSAAAITETFPTNGPITSGQNLQWTSFQSLSVSGGAAVPGIPVSGYVNNRARAGTLLTTQNQFLEGDVRFTPPFVGSLNFGAAVTGRYSASADNSVEFWLYSPDGGASFKVGSYASTNGLFLFHYGLDVDVTSLVSLTTPNRIRLEIAGTSPNVYMIGYLNNAPVWSTLGQSTSSFDGNLGVGFAIQATAGMAPGSVTFDNFSAGDLAPGGVPSSCRQMAVAAAIDQASDGDTISVPAGQCTIANGTAWYNSLAINKRLKIQGAGIDQTVVQDNRNQPITGCCQYESTSILVWNVPTTGGTSELSGITWKGYDVAYRGPNSDVSGDAQFGPSLGMLRINGNGSQKNFRLHHNKFLPRQGCGGGTSPPNRCNSTAGITIANIFGVADHNVADLLVGQAPLGYVFLANYLGVGNYGDNSFAQLSTLGTDQAFYFEDNDFLGDTTSPEFQFALDAFQGARIVYRHNTVRNTVFANHGTDSSGRTERSVRNLESYDNTILAQANTLSGSFSTGFRGGTGMIFNNTLTREVGSGWIGVADMTVFRAHTDALAGSAKDYADLGRCGRVPVTLTWSGGTVTVDSTLQFTFHGANHQYVRITTDGTTPAGYVGTWKVSTNPPTDKQLTFSGPNLGSATAFASSPWDQNSDASGYACLDQAGHGKGDLWPTTQDPANGNPANAVWPNQELEPMYAWLNTMNGSPSLMSPSSMPPGILVANRDYYNISAGPVASRPATCTTGDGWWATDQGNWNTTKAPNTSGRLYKCTATNTWNTWYGPANSTGEPLTYPHPLTVPAVAAAITETFPTDGPITANQNLPWTLLGAPNRLVVSGNKARATDTGPFVGHNQAREGTALPSPNHFVQEEITFTSPTGIAAGGLIARFSASAQTGYFAQIYTTNGGATYSAGLWQMTGGGFPVNYINVPVTQFMTAATTLRLEVSRTSPNITFRLFVNGIRVGSATGVTGFDSETLAGIDIYLDPGAPAGSVQIDNFSAGDLPQPTKVGTIVTAVSCEHGRVSDAIDLADDGDTVIIPAGFCTWTDLTISGKAISLIGAGAGLTNITGTQRLFSLFTKSTGSNPPGFFRLSGFQFSSTGGCGNSPDNQAWSFVGGSGTNVRLDHNAWIANNTCAMLTIGGSSATFGGVADHNTFTINAGAFVTGIFDYSGNGHGDDSWARADNMGAAELFYFENNSIINNDIGYHVTDGWRGGRVVWRYNQFFDHGIGNHGTEASGRDRSMRQMEIYQNDFTFSNVNGDGGLASFRGGTGAIYDNRVHLRNGHTAQFALMNNQRRAGGPHPAHPWGPCGRATATFTRSGGTATATTASAFWTNDAYTCGTFPFCQIVVSGTTSYNGTYPITAWLSDTQVQFSVAGTPGTESGTFQQLWDGNTDGTGYRCMDQPGSGQSSVLTDPLNDGDVQPKAPVANALSPVYCWGNTVETNGGTPVSTGCTSTSDSIVIGRDVINGTVKPGYTSFTYPHPLVSGTVIVPSPVRSIILSWTNNGGDGFTIQRKAGHCLVPGTFTDLIHVTNASHQDNESPFPYACYHVRATLAGAPDSVDSNDDGSYLPMKTAPLRGLRRR